MTRNETMHKDSATVPATAPVMTTGPASALPTVLHVCSEVYPLLKTGGLADVTAALPPALRELGCDARLLLPGFPTVWQGLQQLQRVAEFAPCFGTDAVRLWRGQLENGIVCYLIDSPQHYQRPGNPYANDKHQPYADNHLRFALLGAMAVYLANGADPHWRPQVLHCHDWHAGLAPAYLRAHEMGAGIAAQMGATHAQGNRTSHEKNDGTSSLRSTEANNGASQRRKLAGSVMTIHNLAYQGLFERHLFGQLGLPPQFNDMHGMEFYQQISYLKAGLFYADKISTVSPGYAREILGSEQGCGFDGLLRQRQHDLSGILNGVDPAVWHPQRDRLIAAPFEADNLAGKLHCRQALQQQCGLAQHAAPVAAQAIHASENGVTPKTPANAGAQSPAGVAGQKAVATAAPGSGPLFGVVSRLTEQKGLHLLLAGLPQIIAQGGQVVVLGTGEPGLEQAFVAAAAAHPQSVAVRIGFDEAFAHQIIAGCDVVMVPSRFEPCGLTQLYGLQYGSLPLVHRVGGLADTVADSSLENLDDASATGFVFTEFSQTAFDAAVRRAFALFKRPALWHAVQQQAMQQDVGWQRAANAYLALYRSVAPR